MFAHKEKQRFLSWIRYSGPLLDPRIFKPNGPILYSLSKQWMMRGIQLAIDAPEQSVQKRNLIIETLTSASGSATRSPIQLVPLLLSLVFEVRVMTLQAAGSCFLVSSLMSFLLCNFFQFCRSRGSFLSLYELCIEFWLLANANWSVFSRLS